MRAALRLACATNHLSWADRTVFLCPRGCVQGVLQWRHADVWDLLGNDRVACIHQMEQLLRLTGRAG